MKFAGSSNGRTGAFEALNPGSSPGPAANDSILERGWFFGKIRRGLIINKNTKNMKECINGQSGAIYGLGLIGAAVYFIGNATTFWMGVIGFLKALVWPAFLIHQAFQFLGK